MMNGFKRMMTLGLLCAGSAGAATEVACRVEMERDVVFAGRSQSAVVKVTLDAPMAPRGEERPAVNLCIVMDRSGSMDGKKIEKAREAALTAFRRLDASDIFSLVTYSDRIETIIPATRAGNKSEIEAKIRAITTGGNTALFAGVSQGASEIRKNLGSDLVHRLLLLSDGKANSGPSSPEELGRLGTALRKEGISVTTIGVGTGYNEDLMTAMARNSDGNTYFVESSADLPRIFSTELGDVLSVVASHVVVDVEFPAGIRPIRIIGRDGVVSENTVRISLNQLYGGQEKYALIEVELPESAAGETRLVASARCTYQDMIASRPAVSVGKTMVRFSERKEEILAGYNISVGKDVMLNRAVEVNSQAVQFADEGDYFNASKVMRDNAVILNDFASANSLPELAAEADEYARQAEVVGSSKSMKPKLRKLIITRNYEVENQQQSAPVVKPKEK